MLCQEIGAAINDGDMGAVRQAFRALVDFPRENEIIAASADVLAIHLGDVCRALASDEAIMPGALCDVLEVPRGATYATGAQAAADALQEITLVYRRHYSALARRAG